ncbi:MAG: glycosyltransferase family 2 protein [Candidatus Gastranaerophilales bacterium]|nr:glycosyltransferase family 2 protein [Candidatus Gastranaerophilales bacterium]
MENLNFVKEPKISIIITYFNMSKFIGDCIKSILIQTYQNFEIIIVNDGSKNEDRKALNNFQNNQIKIVDLDSNKGQLYALYKGLEHAEGEFICMVDADDILLPNYLKTLLLAHLKNNYALISSNRGDINENGEILSLGVNNSKINYSELENLYKTKEYFEVQKVKAPFGLWSWNPSTSAMWRKNAIEILQYFPDKEYWHTGADKVIFSLLHLIGGSANIDTVCFLYRIHTDNNFNSSKFSGNKKYISEKTVNKLIDWNIKLRLDTIKMFIKNKKQIVEKYNKINYLKMLFKVVFCINMQICAKVIKTLAHKVINL